MCLISLSVFFGFFKGGVCGVDFWNNGVTRL